MTLNEVSGSRSSGVELAAVQILRVGDEPSFRLRITEPLSKDLRPECRRHRERRNLIADVLVQARPKKGRTAAAF